MCISTIYMQMFQLCKLSEVHDDPPSPLLGCVLGILRDNNAIPLSGAALYSTHKWLHSCHRIDLADIILLIERRRKHNATNYRPSAPTSDRLRIDIVVKIIFVEGGLTNATTDTTFLKYQSFLKSGAAGAASWKIHAGGFRLAFR